jgi:CO/xanthine dehydrogenase Mo-binding subunit
MSAAPEPLAIGRATPRWDGLAKAQGREVYASDLFPEGLVWAGALRAGVAHARIVAIDGQAAAALPGVLAVLTAADVPGSNRQGIVRKDQPVLAETTVRHEGEALALVLAETRALLADALALIRVELQELPDDPGQTPLAEAEIRTGEAEPALAQCPLTVALTVTLPSQAHGFLEPENGVAWLAADGVLRLVVSTQAPFRDRFEVAHALGLPLDQVQVRAPSLGGGFGGKDGATVQCLLGLAALHSGGRPVKMVWSREESFRAGSKRHPARIQIQAGALADGTLQAVLADLTYDTGAYAHLGAEVLELGMEHAMGPYRVAHVAVTGRALFSHQGVAGAMRGFGVCQSTFAIERAMDALADRVGLDRLSFRLHNALRRGDRNGSGVTLAHSTGLVACLETLREHPLWRERAAWRAAAPPGKRRGTGVVAVWNAMGYGRGLADSAIARIECTAQGSFRIYSGVPDMGQGNGAAFVQIAGQELCQAADRLELVQPDSERCHPSGSASAGRTTYTFGNALRLACAALREKLLHRAALLLGLDETHGLLLLPGRVRHLPSGRELALEQLAALLPEADRACVAQWLMPVAQDRPDTGHGFQIGFPHALFSYGAQLARVEVDLVTGAVQVCAYLACSDAGRVLNPLDYHGQVQGAVAQGLGWALTEDLRFEQGRLLNPTFQEYLLPTALDLPEILSIAVDGVEETGPYGMKGIGEVASNGPAPALASALEEALGRCPQGPPFTAERVLALLDGEWPCA